MQFRTLKKAQSKKTYIKASPIHGIGLYANEDITANEMICEYNGEVSWHAGCHGNHNR